MIGRETLEHFPREAAEPPEDRNGVKQWRYSDTGVPLLGCAFSDGASDEPLEVSRNQVISDAQALVPAKYSISEFDRIRARGVLYEVDGRPQDWRSRTMSRRPGLVVNLKNAEG
jgi:hypothetical protein